MLTGIVCSVTRTVYLGCSNTTKEWIMKTTLPQTINLSDRVIRKMAESADMGHLLTGERLAEVLTELLALRWSKRWNIRERFPLESKLPKEVA